MKIASNTKEVFVGVTVLALLMYGCVTSGYSAMDAELRKYDAQRAMLEQLGKPIQYSKAAKEATVWKLTQQGEGQ